MIVFEISREPKNVTPVPVVAQARQPAMRIAYNEATLHFPF
jgi:hypothetical protein